jgi:hypothetical protein
VKELGTGLVPRHYMFISIVLSDGRVVFLLSSSLSLLLSFSSSFFFTLAFEELEDLEDLDDGETDLVDSE